MLIENDEHVIKESLTASGLHIQRIAICCQA